MRTEITAFGAAALTAAGLIGWSVGQLATGSVASAAQLTSSESRKPAPTVQRSSSTAEATTPCPAHRATTSG